MFRDLHFTGKGEYTDTSQCVTHLAKNIASGDLRQYHAYPACIRHVDGAKEDIRVAGAGAENAFSTTHSLMDASLGTDAVKKLIAHYLAPIEMAGRSAMISWPPDGNLGP